MVIGHVRARVNIFKASKSFRTRSNKTVLDTTFFSGSHFFTGMESLTVLYAGIFSVLQNPDDLGILSS